MNPENVNKYVYVEKTPTWIVRTVYAIGIVVWMPVLFATINLARNDAFFTWFVLPIVCILTLHYLTSFSLNLFYRQFDIKKHNRMTKRFWKTHDDPSVDVFLPICGEDMAILENTWKYVSRLEYANKRVYVLDDSKEDLDEHKRLAEHYGFNYMSRPNRGEMKKAGNLKYGYERTNGDFIAIFDADFAPRSDYLRELIPYMSDPYVGIVQSPQYFSTEADIHKSSPLAYGGARAQEIFYRIIQVSRDRLGGAHCCGTCAVYRRAALASIGGFVQMTHSEDAHTGLGIQIGGYTIRYVPLAVSVGLSPDDPHAFFHQQHRWCLGNMLMLVDGKFWTAPISWKAKFCYITGFLFYLHQPFVILFSFQLFWILLFYGKFVSLAAGLPFYPHVVWAFAYMFFFYISEFRWGYLYAITLRMYAYCHAISTVILGGTVGWIATGSKYAGVSSAYRQTVAGVSVCILAYLACIAIAMKAGAIRLFDYNYYSLEFWILFNLGLTAMLLWQMYRRMIQAQENLIADGSLVKSSLEKWRFKTAGAYTALAAGIFLGIAYAPVSINIGHNSLTAIQAVSALPSAMQTTSPSTPFRFTTDYEIGDQGPDILSLQQFLNKHGYIVSQTGPGSPGNETTYFGPATQQALIKFQLANGLKTDGYFGWNTRDFINSNTVFAVAPTTTTVASVATSTLKNIAISSATATIVAKVATPTTTIKLALAKPMPISAPISTKTAPASTTSTKMLPYSIDTFTKSEGWQDHWGNLSIATDSLTIGASATGTSGGVLLGGTSAWSDYMFQATLDWVKGETFGLMAQYQNNENYAVCEFSEPYLGEVQMSLEQYIDGNEHLLTQGDVPDYNQWGGSNITASIQIRGTQGICSFDNHVVSNNGNGYTLDPPFSGGIGFTTWDPNDNDSQIVIGQISVTPF